MISEKYGITKYDLDQGIFQFEDTTVIAADARTAVELSCWADRMTQASAIVHHYHTFGARADTCYVQCPDGTLIKSLLYGWFETGRLRSGDQGGRTYFCCGPEISDATDPDSGLQIVRIDIPIDDLETDSYLATGCGCEWGRGIECVLDEMEAKGIIADWGAGWKIILGYRRGFYYVDREARELSVADSSLVEATAPENRFAVCLG